jgi:hypothetical protein
VISSPLLRGYDELKIVSYSIAPFCLTGADGEQHTELKAQAFHRAAAKSIGNRLGVEGRKAWFKASATGVATNRKRWPVIDLERQPNEKRFAKFVLSQR